MCDCPERETPPATIRAGARHSVVARSRIPGRHRCRRLSRNLAPRRSAVRVRLAPSHEVAGNGPFSSARSALCAARRPGVPCLGRIRPAYLPQRSSVPPDCAPREPWCRSSPASSRPSTVPKVLRGRSPINARRGGGPRRSPTRPRSGEGVGRLPCDAQLSQPEVAFNRPSGCGWGSATRHCRAAAITGGRRRGTRTPTGASWVTTSPEVVELSRTSRASRRVRAELDRTYGHLLRDSEGAIPGRTRGAGLLSWWAA